MVRAGDREGVLASPSLLLPLTRPSAATAREGHCIPNRSDDPHRTRAGGGHNANPPGACTRNKEHN